MTTTTSLEELRGEAAQLIRQAGLVVTPAEEAAIEIADFGLGDFRRQGLAILVYVNTDRCCAKELAMWPGQTCPEHRHPSVGGSPGKEETFRCRWGSVRLYVSGPASPAPACQAPAGGDAYTVWHEVTLRPGDQYTISPDTLHWFQAGPQGAVISEFSTRSTDENDVFTDRSIRRIPD
jgi:D-lyxose ketol-isomerase